MQTGSDNLNMTSAPPDPKAIKKKALLLIKARQERDEDDDDPNNFFPTGIENEVVFMELTGKTLSNLYASCQVSGIFWKD